MGRKISLDGLMGRTVAIDALNSLYQFVSSIRGRGGEPLMDSHNRVTSHLVGLFYRTASIVGHGIRPAYVFDGEPHPLKRLTVEGRREMREDALRAWEEARRAGRLEDARSLAARAGRVTGEMVRESEELLGYMGVPCVPPKTKIMTPDGLKEIRKIKEGDLVLTHRGRFMKVTKTFRRAYKGTLYEISAWCSPVKTLLTPEHPVLAFKRPKKTKRRPWAEQKEMWIEAKNLKKGDCTVLQTPSSLWKSVSFDLKSFDGSARSSKTQVWYKSKQTIPRFVKLSIDLASLIGYYISEGSTSVSNQQLEFSFGDEPNYASEVVEKIKGVFGTNSSIRHRKNRISVRVCSKILSTFFSKLCGRGARNKHMPKEVLCGDVGPLAEVVECIRKGDGCIYKRETHFSTISKQLASDLKIALIRLGYKPRIYFDRKRGEYVISFSQFSNRNYIHSNKSWFLKSGRVAFLVKKVRQKRYVGNVYNLEVEEDNSYISECLVLHNCVQAPGEGEAQCAYIARRGHAYATASSDFDALLFGTPRLVRNLAITGRRKLPGRKEYISVEPELIGLEGLLSDLGITRRQLVDACIICGTDFNEGIKGLGPNKALALIKKHGSVKRAARAEKLEFEVDPDEVRRIFLRPNVTRRYELRWRDPSPTKIMEFLCDERGFSPERVQGGVDNLMRGAERRAPARVRRMLLRCYGIV